MLLNKDVFSFENICIVIQLSDAKGSLSGIVPFLKIMH